MTRERTIWRDRFHEQEALRRKFLLEIMRFFDKPYNNYSSQEIIDVLEHKLKQLHRNLELSREKEWEE